MKTIRIVIADDHPVLRSGLKTLLTLQPGIEVAGEASSCEETLRVVAETHPDILLLDLSMPDGGGLKAIPLLMEASPATRILVFTMHDDPSYLRAAMQAGVAGYVVKSADLSELSVAIRAIGEGRTYLSIPVRSEGLGAMLNEPASPSEAPQAQLSRREAQVLRLIALGHTYREIADQLHVSERSVETYRSRISSKLNLETRVELVRYALSSGLLQNAG